MALVGCLLCALGLAWLYAGALVFGWLPLPPLPGLDIEVDPPMRSELPFVCKIIAVGVALVSLGAACALAGLTVQGG